ncbi:MAG: hypothetical protein IKL68_01365 [Clostridia bacterium]|nr:hypothetical protein [Clostridia bacterium]
MKKILISAVITLVILLLSIGVLELVSNKDIVEIPIVTKDINEGDEISQNISYIEIKLKTVEKDILTNIVKKEEIVNMVASKNISKGEILVKNKLISKENYLIKTENLEYVSLPVKNATEGVAYRIKSGDKINVYYTAKRKLVESILKNKVKVYSTNKEDTMVTCLLYQNIEVVALTNNLGIEVADGTATNILVRITSEEILEFANLKEQGIFTYTLT